MLPEATALKEISLLKLSELLTQETRDLLTKVQTEEELKIYLPALLKTRM